ncbi:MAG TPA: rhomboid family intramembrane serine protease [Candidatus Aquilonibacter sp.]|nr:rhomboid family intramembrane serine protease [Candidatus Aquilonibacter sp.]
MRSNGPTLLALPPFRGLTRKLIILAGVSLVFFFILGIVARGFEETLYYLLVLLPEEAPKMIWRFVTWPFVPDGFLSFLFAMLSFWYFGSALEEERGTRWFGELFFVSVIGGGILTTLISLTIGRYFLPIIGPPGKYSEGLWPIVIALLVVYARLHANETLTFDFIFRARAKYIAAIFLVVYLVIDYFVLRRVDALNTICNCLVAWIFLQVAPRRGLRHGVSETWFGLRNRYYRGKRRRAARKFQVYMRKRGKDVNIDASGRYIGLDDDDPNDRHRMN